MENMKRALSAATVALCILSSCSPEKKPEVVDNLPQEKSSSPRPVERMTYTLINTYPHDPTAFTEGLLFYGDKLLESTGAPDHLPQTRSTLGEVDLNTGKLNVKAELDKKIYFGEGIVVLNDKIYQVTWQNQKGFIYDAKTYRNIGQFSYPNKEGWGLTTDGKSIIMSDGTFNLTWINPETFAVEKELPVTKEGYGLDRLNELEYIKGFIYANIWMSNLIVKIDAETGEVVGQMDLSDLYERARKINPQLSEMNGIAWDPQTGNVLVTGKMWPNIFEINFRL
jgi:glutaminyl-peptide cyclotransferase